MSWTEVRWDEVTYTDQCKIRCFGCSKRLSRQRTFRASLRPGVTRFEIRAELRELAVKWKTQLRGVCADCMRTGQYVQLPDGNFALKFTGSGDRAEAALQG